MQLAIDVAGFDAAGADQLRRAMGSKRSTERMARAPRPALRRHGRANGITGALADDIFVKLSAFANYGFPESHAMSFAYLVYASAWLKRYHPAAFLRRAAQRPADGLLLTAVPGRRRPPARCRGAPARHQRQQRPGDPGVHEGHALGQRAGQRTRTATVQWGPRRAGGPAGAAERAHHRRRHWPNASSRSGAPTARTATCRDLARRVAGTGTLTSANLEALATADAFACFSAEPGRA